MVTKNNSTLSSTGPVLILVTEEKHGVTGETKSSRLILTGIVLLAVLSLIYGWWQVSPNNGKEEAEERVAAARALGTKPVVQATALPELKLNQKPVRQGPEVQANPGNVGKTDPFKP